MKILKQIIEPVIKVIFQNYDLDFEKFEYLIQTPRDTNVCDLCIPCFSLAKIMKKQPMIIAEEIASKANEMIKENITINATNGYVNFYSDAKWLAKKMSIAALLVIVQGDATSYISLL